MDLTFQEENNALLTEIVKSIMDQWTGKNASDRLLELYITGDCNQKCEYCYLVKYGDQIYPKGLRNFEQILKNLKLLLNYLLENNLIPFRIDLFSGEILGTKLGNSVLDILLDYIKRGFSVKNICIPTNMSFCLTNEGTKVMDNYIQQFRKEDCAITLSCSMDGLIVDKMMRPFNDNTSKLKTKEYYNRVISFCSKYSFGYHPMISAASLDYQKENYKTWLKILHLMYPTEEEFKANFGKVMQLVVRNNDWTDENIEKYLSWLNFLIDTDKKEYFDNDNKLFFDNIFTHKIDEYQEVSYLPYLISEYPSFSCTIGGMLCIRLGDLAICPCHRTAYDKYLLGKFEVKDDKIIGIKANNVQLASAIYLTNTLIKPKCGECPISLICIKGCLGSQYENTNEIFYPVDSVCHLLKVKYLFLYIKFNKMLKENNLKVSDYKPLILLSTKIKNLLQSEDLSKWIQYIQSLV